MSKVKKAKRFPLPLRYPGGKFYAMDVLRPFFEGVKHDEYREPFAGGATVFFNKDKAKHNVLNDMDIELVTLYKVLQDETQRQLLDERYLDEPEATKERWREVMDFSPSNDLDIAWKYYFLNRTSFSGKLVSAAWGYRPKRSLPPHRWHERINPAGEKLENVEITHGDFSKAILKEAKDEGGKVLMYVDPPYYLPPKNKHYRHGLDKEDHVRLAECLKRTKHNFFLTYDDCEEIREIYKWANIYELQFIYRVQDSNTSSGSRKTGFELVITNFVPESFKREREQLELLEEV
ncbi:DNA adenine methylase [Vibrio parahaemolyticus]